MEAFRNLKKNLQLWLQDSVSQRALLSQRDTSQQGGMHRNKYFDDSLSLSQREARRQGSPQFQSINASLNDKAQGEKKRIVSWSREAHGKYPAKPNYHDKKFRQGLTTLVIILVLILCEQDSKILILDYELFKSKALCLYHRFIPCISCRQAQVAM